MLSTSLHRGRSSGVRPNPFADLRSARSICNPRRKNPQSPKLGIRPFRRCAGLWAVVRCIDRIAGDHRNRVPRTNQKRKLTAFARQSNAPPARNTAVHVDLAPTHQSRPIAGRITLHDAIDRTDGDARLATGAGIAIDERRQARAFFGRMRCRRSAHAKRLVARISCPIRVERRSSEPPPARSLFYPHRADARKRSHGAEHAATRSKSAHDR